MRTFVRRDHGDIDKEMAKQRKFDHVFMRFRDRIDREPTQVSSVVAHRMLACWRGADRGADVVLTRC